MKSQSVYFNLPIRLIQGIDDYLAVSRLDISRSALLKFCLTFDVNLSPNDRIKAITLADTLARDSCGKYVSVGLRCRKPIKPTTKQILQISNVLVMLHLDRIF